MNLEILGARALVRAYSLPEKIGSIITPEHWREGWDGKMFEVEQVGEGFKAALTCVGNLGPKMLVAVREKGDPPLEVEPDDIIQLRGGGFRGIYAGGQVERDRGKPCWFIDAVETATVGGVTKDVCAIEWIWPCKAWRTAA